MDSQDNQQIDQDDLLLLGIQLPDANYLEEKEYDEKRYKEDIIENTNVDTNTQKDVNIPQIKENTITEPVSILPRYDKLKEQYKIDKTEQDMNKIDIIDTDEIKIIENSCIVVNTFDDGFQTMEEIKELAKKNHQDIIEAKKISDEINLERRIRTNMRRRRKWLEEKDIAIQPSKISKKTPSDKDTIYSKDSSYISAVYNVRNLTDKEEHIRNIQKKKVNKQQSFHGRQWKSETEMILRQQYD